MLVDSHCHLDDLDLSEYHNDLQQALTAAHANDVGHFLCVSVELDRLPTLIDIATRYEHIDFSVGVHPNSTATPEPDVEQLVQLAQHPKCVAIGETGLDYYRTQGDMQPQQQRFRNHIRAAITVHKPLIIHTRAAAEDTLLIMQQEQADRIGGVMHCFTESWEIAERALALNFYISFSGIITFKNATELQEVVKHVPLENMLIETDSPYLAPIPYRGKPNQPAYVKYVAEAVAQLKNISYDEVAKVTTENFFRLFARHASKLS